MAAKPDIEFQRVEPRLFGRIPRLGLLGSGAVLLLAAIVMFAFADWVLGPMLLVLGLLLLGLYRAAARHLPASRLARRATGGLWRGRDELRLAGTFAGAWTRAGWRVVCVERECRRVRRERKATQHALGAAAYAGDEPAMEQLRERMRDLDEQIAASATHAEEARLAARQEVSDARAPLRRTEISRP
jgi:hypothetical protein